VGYINCNTIVTSLTLVLGLTKVGNSSLADLTLPECRFPS